MVIVYNLHNLDLGFAPPKQGGKFPAQLAGRAHQRINSTGGIAFCFAKQGGIMKLSLIIPCYNEEESLPFIYAELVKVSAELSDYEIEYLFINDGSKDHTLDKLKEMAASDTRVRYFSFSRNFGKEAAMYAGFCNAKGDYVAVMDADLQDPPSLLPQMLSILQTGEYDSA